MSSGGASRYWRCASGDRGSEEPLNRRPYDRDALVALVTYEMESGDLISAASRARLLSRLEPESEDIRQLLGEIENAMKGKP